MTQDVERQSSVGFEFALPVQKHEEWTVDKPLQRHCLVPEFNDDGSLSAVTLIPARGETLQAHYVHRETGSIVSAAFTHFEREELYPNLSTKMTFEGLVRNYLAGESPRDTKRIAQHILDLNIVILTPQTKRNYAAANRILDRCESPVASYADLAREAENARHKQLFGLIALL